MFKNGDLVKFMITYSDSAPSYIIRKKEYQGKVLFVRRSRKGYREYKVCWVEIFTNGNGRCRSNTFSESRLRKAK